MVIQRSWKTQNESGTNPSILQINATSSSEDSNSSNQMNTITIQIANNTSSKMDAIKYATTPQMAENVLGRLKQRFGNHVSGRKTSSDAAMRSLELLRITIQSAFDKDVDIIVKKFIEVYFKPAIKNIKENLGDHVVSEEMLQKMMCALLENSKAQYNMHRNKPSSIINTSSSATTADVNLVKPESSTQTNFALKRSASKLPNTDTPTQVMKKPTLISFQQQQTTPASSGVAITPAQMPSSTSNTTSTAPQPSTQPKAQTQTQPQPQPQPQQQQQQQQQQQSTRVAAVPQRRQIYWNTAAISTETNFVLDVQANQAFGFGTDGKERLASKHPELIRYLPDGQDRDWLVEQKIVPAQNRNSRFLFLIYDEVKKLGETDLYKNREKLNLSILHIFKIPNFIIQKMKLFFIDLNIKSRGLITNSYSAIANSSHLRNALLQGSNQTASSSAPSTLAASTSVNSVSTSTDSATSPPKSKSSLSSSHATLTALLTNNIGTGTSAKIIGNSEKRLTENSQSGSNSDVSGKMDGGIKKET